jgi:hypothetical protein
MVSSFVGLANVEKGAAGSRTPELGSVFFSSRGQGRKISTLGDE